MHKSRLGDIVIDCHTDDLQQAASFWSAALGYPLPDEIDVESGFVLLQTPPGEVQVIIQQVKREAGVHLDIETDSIEKEIQRLEGLGAKIVTRHEGWTVMQAPTGQLLCVGKPYRGGFEQGANEWE